MLPPHRTCRQSSISSMVAPRWKFMRRRRILKVLLALGVMFLVAALAAWLLPHQVLTVDSGEVKGDVLVVLGGGSLERVERATELFKARTAARIICTGEGDCESNKRE